jgi:AraC-like DNA-binding protein
MSFNFLNIIILLGCLQGFILSALLFISAGKNLAGRLLATLLFLLSLASLNIYLSESNTPWQVGVVLSLVPTIILMPFGPLIYFYTRSVLDVSFRLRNKHKRQFLPVIIDVLPAIAGWILTIGYIVKSFSQNYLLQWGDVIDQYNSYSDIPRWISITGYLLLTKRFLNQYYATPKKQEKQKHRNHLPWLKLFLNSFLVFQLVWLVFLVPYIIPSSRFDVLENVGYYPIYIPLAILIYWLGFKGYLHARLTANSSSEVASIQLSQLESERLMNAIVKAMEEDKLYLEPDFNLSALVKHVRSQQRLVSHVLNNHFAQSFNSFVNYYRIEEVKRRLMDPASEHLTLSGIAFESGFNSQATFQRVFKQATHLTPKEFASRQKQVKAG